LSSANGPKKMLHAMVKKFAPVKKIGVLEKVSFFFEELDFKRTKNKDPKINR
jgi:hypothetical protein